MSARGFWGGGMRHRCICQAALTCQAPQGAPRTHAALSLRAGARTKQRPPVSGLGLAHPQSGHAICAGCTATDGARPDSRMLNPLRDHRSRYASPRTPEPPDCACHATALCACAHAAFAALRRPVRAGFAEALRPRKRHPTLESVIGNTIPTAYPRRDSPLRCHASTCTTSTNVVPCSEMFLDTTGDLPT